MTDDGRSNEADRDKRLFTATGSILAQVQYEPTSDQELATAIADQAGTEAETYRGSPLHDYIDVDAIETLLFGTQPDQSIGPASQNITFQYRGVLVTVRTDGVIQLSGTDSNRVKKD
jgi:hypothetical protein